MCLLMLAINRLSYILQVGSDSYSLILGVNNLELSIIQTNFKIFMILLVLYLNQFGD